MHSLMIAFTLCLNSQGSIDAPWGHWSDSMDVQVELFFWMHEPKDISSYQRFKVNSSSALKGHRDGNYTIIVFGVSIRTTEPICHFSLSWNNPQTTVDTHSHVVDIFCCCNSGFQKFRKIQLLHVRPPNIMKTPLFRNLICEVWIIFLPRTSLHPVEHKIQTSFETVPTLS